MNNSELETERALRLAAEKRVQMAELRLDKSWAEFDKAGTYKMFGTVEELTVKLQAAEARAEAAERDKQMLDWLDNFWGSGRSEEWEYFYIRSKTPTLREAVRAAMAKQESHERK